MSTTGISRKSHSVLIVEDDPFILDILAHKFARNKWDVISVQDGENGLKEAEEKSPNIILLDILLPGINGYEVLKQLKGNEHLRRIPVLVLSNYGQEDEVQKSIELGAVDHLIKAHVILDEVVDKAENIVTDVK